MLRKALETEKEVSVLTPEEDGKMGNGKGYESKPMTIPVELSRRKDLPESIPSNNLESLGSMDPAEREREQYGSLSSSWRLMEKNRGKQMSLSNSFSAKSPIADAALIRTTDKLPEDGLVVIVDPFSTGLHLAAQAAMYGLKVARVFSIWNSPISSLVQQGIEVDFCATIQHNNTHPDANKAVEETIDSLKSLSFPVIAVVPGAESGVELADMLSARMGLRTNGEKFSRARRNKYRMGEAVRASGIRAVEQKFCLKTAEIKEFATELAETLKKAGKAFKCIVKPVESAGTDDVFLCLSVEQAVVAFKTIRGKKNGIGLQNHGALIQEYLEGNEYVLDKVSLNGVHKLVAIWEYDKREANGASFVYFGMRLVKPNTKVMQEIREYGDKVLDALCIENGPSHMEVMYSEETGPCLVEVGSRCHGGEGTWLPVVKECIGYSQVEIAMDVYLSGDRFKEIDRCEYPLMKAGMDVDLVNRHSGILRSIIGETKFRQLPSFRNVCWEVNPGDFMPKTVDAFTRPGCIQLVNESEEVVNADLEFVHKFEQHGLFDYSIICPMPPVVGSVVVVDPFSTGANLSAGVIRMGYKLIMVFSEVDSPISNLVSEEGKSTKPSSVIYHDSKLEDEEKAYKQTVDAIWRATNNSNSPLLAILAGAETGVILADVLSNRLSCRTNGEELTEARRNKAKMQERIGRPEAGLRSVKQALAKTSQDVIDFLDSLNSPKCVVKPNMSAGSDSIFLCTSIDEALDAFQSIDSETNGLGHVNDGALCQEFLEGTEYVVDGVSRDGVYKVTAIWEYDKRSVNGANFVYFGMRLRDSRGEREQQIVEYAEAVTKELGILQGPSHMEVMFCSDGPCLVEVGSRCHGGEGTWLPIVEECIGYSQVEATLDCYLRPDRFDALPSRPILLKQGLECHLVSYFEGQLVEVPGIETIKALTSFRRMELLIQPGMKLSRTVDCFTRPGSIQMVADIVATLEDDYRAIRNLENGGMFDVQS